MSTPRIWESPYVFAYDITDDDRRDVVLKCLKRWRVDGQYSVHETWLRSFQMRDLSVELISLIDRKEDSLLVCRLDQRKSSPVYHKCFKHKSQPMAGKPLLAPLPSHLPNGDYMVCYDIRDPKRLRRIQRLTAKRTIFLQRSVYLYRGSGSGLISLVEKVSQSMKDNDDLRIYNMCHIRDMWFLSDDQPAIQEMRLSQVQVANLSFWQRLLLWIKGNG
jgi:CRISPR-associated endonuclease Cas2